VKEEEIANAIGKNTTALILDGASLPTNAITVIVAPREHLVTLAPMVGWSATRYVQAKGTDSANIA